MNTPMLICGTHGHLKVSEEPSYGRAPLIHVWLSFPVLRRIGPEIPLDPTSHITGIFCPVLPLFGQWQPAGPPLHLRRPSTSTRVHPDLPPCTRVPGPQAGTGTGQISMVDAFLRTLRLLILPLVLAFLFRHHSSNASMVRPEDVPRLKLNNGKEIPVIGLGMLAIVVLQPPGRRV